MSNRSGTPQRRGGVVVRCEGVGQVYDVDGDHHTALVDVSFEVPAGQTVALYGPSGSGKSTLTALLAGLRRPTSGEVVVGDATLSRLPERRLLEVRGRDIGVVVQNPSRSLLPHGTAVDNIRFARRGARGATTSSMLEPHELLRELGLAQLADQQVARLSGGEQQRLSVAVAMATSPRLLLADEPTSQLDRLNRDRVVELVARIADRFGTTVMTVTHDPVVAAAAERTITLGDGRIVSDVGRAARVDGYTTVVAGRHRAVDPRPGVPDRSEASASGTSAAVAIRVRGLRYARAGRTILDGIDLDLVAGEAVALVGPSGSGKSSLLAVLAGLEAPDAGTVSGIDGDARRGLVLQGYGLVGVLTGAENVEAPLQAGAAGALRPSQVRERAAGALEQVGLSEVADHLVEELSGGQQQRVAVARALAVVPDVLFADEPTAELDRDRRASVVESMLAVARRGGIVVLATHDLDLAQRCDRIVEVVDGRVA